jgi:glycosyltransferase involved in cell wall biosynthesis
MAFRVLTQINYSAGQNPEGDSGLRFLCGLLRALVRLDPEFHFYVLTPARHAEVWAAALAHPRITPLPVAIEPRLHGGDFQFCPVRLAGCFDFRSFDVDVLFLNQPETAPAFLHYFNRQTFHNVPAVSYVHWFDTRRPSTPKETLHHPALLGALAGAMVSAAVGCNSAYGRDQLMAHAVRWFRDEAVAALSGRLRVLPPGVDVAEIEAARPARGGGRRRILVNHRLLKYTGVRSLLADTFPKLWQRRQDFSVLVTNPTRVRLPATITQAPWLTVRTLSRPEYLRCLWECDIVVAPHRSCHWSISTLEAVCAECVPIMNREGFFAELMRPLLGGLSDAERTQVESRWFYFRGCLVARLSELLDNLPRERRLVTRVAAEARHTYDWDNLAPAWRQLFRESEARTPIMAEDNPSMRRIVEFLRREKRASKVDILKHLGWAPKQRALSWTAFRKRLKLLTREDPSRPDSVFELDADPPTRRCLKRVTGSRGARGQEQLWDS